MKITEATRITFPPLHKYQKIVHDDPHRFKVLVAGRRFGKSQLAMQTCLELAVNEGKVVWFISPTFRNVRVHWRAAKQLVGKLATHISESNKYMEFQIGKRLGSVSFESGKTPDNLLGSGLDYVVIDEAAVQQSDLWETVVSPMLLDRKGGALFISTPRGTANWFYRLYLRGQDPNEPEWASFRYPSSYNSTIPDVRDEIAKAKKRVPENKFKQEYLAEFTSEDGGVFRKLEEVCVLKPTEPVSGDLYYFGVDWGRVNDYTAISIFNQKGEQVYLDRFTEVGWAIQRARLVALYEKWRPIRINAEANSVGAVNIEALQAENLPVKPYYMTNKTKADLIENLAFGLERGEYKLLSPYTYEGEVQMSEMVGYEYKVTASGMVSYNSQEDMHDDTVIAAALSVADLRRLTKNKINEVPNPFYGGQPDARSYDLPSPYKN